MKTVKLYSFFCFLGIQVTSVKKVTSVLYFAKEVKVNGRPELLEVRVKDVSHKDVRVKDVSHKDVRVKDVRVKDVSHKDVSHKEGVVETAWHPCIEVDLKIIDLMDSSTGKKKLGAGELVQRFEAMRDCWLQLARGLLTERP